MLKAILTIQTDSEELYEEIVTLSDKEIEAILETQNLSIIRMKVLEADFNDSAIQCFTEHVTDMML